MVVAALVESGVTRRSPGYAPSRVAAHRFFAAAAIFLRVAGDTVRFAPAVASLVRGRLRPRGASARPTSASRKRSAVRRMSCNWVTNAWRSY